MAVPMMVRAPDGTESEFPSMSAVVRHLNISRWAAQHYCGKTVPEGKLCGLEGWSWRRIIPRGHRLRVLATAPSGATYRFRSMTEAARELGVSTTVVRDMLHGRSAGVANNACLPGWTVEEDL